MSAKTITMEQLKTILRLQQEGHSIKNIVRLTGLSRNTVKRYLKRNAPAPCDPATDSDKQIAGVLYNEDTTSYKGARYQALLAHFEGAERELLKKGVTRLLLWQEYSERQSDTERYSYSQYCYYLHEYLQKKDVVMHLNYKAGEMMMIDFAGTRYPYVDIDTGEQLSCEVFVATLPYSGLIFYQAVPSQQTMDFAEAINAMLKYFGGVPQTILCDNLKTAVTRSDRYEPLFTDLCYQLSAHYGTTFSATRPRRPRDKAMVEKAVRLLYQNVYAPLRYQVFTSIKEINHHFYPLLNQLNNKPYKGSPYSRRDLFDREENQWLHPLPSEPFMLKKGVTLTVQRNYHVQLTEDHHYYSVPYRYAGKKVRVWYDSKRVEIYYNHERIALHARSRNGYNTLEEHMPPNHQKAKQASGWSKEELLDKAARIGSYTQQAAEKILSTSVYMEQNYKACFGMLMLAKRYGTTRLEAACKRALTGSRINYTLIKNILKAGLDRGQEKQPELPLPPHDNIRGPEHYR